MWPYLSKDGSLCLVHNKVFEEVLDVAVTLVPVVLVVDCVLLSVQSTVAQLNHRFWCSTLNRKSACTRIF